MFCLFFLALLFIFSPKPGLPPQLAKITPLAAPPRTDRTLKTFLLSLLFPKDKKGLFPEKLPHFFSSVALLTV